MALQGNVSEDLLFDQIITLTRVKSLENFLGHEFGSFKLIESVNNFFKYSIPEGIKISKLFGELERNVI